MADEKLCLKWNDFQDQAQASFQELRSDNDFTDVTLACEDQSIKAHKVILSACSPVFKKLLKAHPHPQPLIYVKGMKSSSLIAIINFLYFGQIDILHEELDNFLGLAEELQLKGFDGVFDETSQDRMPPYNEAEKMTNMNEKKVIPEWTMPNAEAESKTKVCEGLTMKTGSGIEPNTRARIESMFEKSTEGYNCTKCGYKTKRLCHMKDHVQKHIEGLEYPCNICKRTFKSSPSFREHKRRCFV